MKPGDKVKWSEYALRPLRDYWLCLGSNPAKSRAREEYDRKRERRGTVLAVGANKWSNHVADVRWDDGSVSHCLDYMVEVVT